MTIRADELLHQLWSQAVGTDGYDKEKWKELQRLIEAEVYGKKPTAPQELIRTTIIPGDWIDLCRECYDRAGNKAR